MNMPCHTLWARALPINEDREDDTLSAERDCKVGKGWGVVPMRPTAPRQGAGR